MIRPVFLAAALALIAAASGHAQQPAASAAPAASVSPTPADAANKEKPTDAELRKRLTPEQYRVTCEADTEPAFHNAYWNNHAAGIYVDVINGKPLFSSQDKFDSGTGWPSFTKPLVKDNVRVQTDKSFGMQRDEVKSNGSDAHLGHLFDDGPAEKAANGYCMNSASLRFVPVDKLATEGYGQFLTQFGKDAKGDKVANDAKDEKK